MPSFAQIAGVLRIAAPVIVWGVTQYFGADAGTQIGSLIATILGSGGWSLYANSTTNLAQTVAAVPGVQVAVSRSAPVELLKLANDPNVADVVPVAVPLPSTSPPKDPYRSALGPAKDPYETTRRSS